MIVIGRILELVLKLLVKILAGIMLLALEFAKVFLVLLCFVFKIFMAFVDGAEI